MLFLVEFVRGAFLVSFLPIYAEDALGFSVAFVGAAVSVHYFFDTAVKCLAGYLLDRFSLRVIVLFGLLVSLLGLLSMYWIHYPWMLILSSAVFGIGISPLWLVSLSKVSSGDQRALQMGMLYSVWLVGLGGGPVVLNFVLDRGFGFAFWLMITLWTLAWVLALSMKNQVHNIPEYLPFKKQMIMLWERLKAMRLLVPGMILQTAAAGILVPILPSFAERAALITSAVLLGGIALFYMFVSVEKESVSAYG